MDRIGFSCIHFSLNDQSFENLAGAGITDIELSLSPEEQSLDEMKRIKRLADEYGISIWSYHLPFSSAVPFNLATTEHEIRRRTMECWTETIHLAGEIGVDKFVVHPSDGASKDEVIRNEQLNLSISCLNSLVEVADKYHADIAVENLPRTCLGSRIDEFEKLISGNDKLKVCFDTNHLLYDKHSDFIKRFGTKIITLHVSDYDYVDERHWLPGEGKINWHELYASLVGAGYNGAWLYEVSLERPGGNSRKLSDYVQNAREIFEGKPLTVFG